MKRNLGSALRDELDHVHVDYALKARILKEAKRGPRRTARRERGHWLPVAYAAAVLALLVLATALILRPSTTHPDLVKNPVLTLGDGLAGGGGEGPSGTAQPTDATTPAPTEMVTPESTVAPVPTQEETLDDATDAVVESINSSAPEAERAAIDEESAAIDADDAVEPGSVWIDPAVEVVFHADRSCEALNAEASILMDGAAFDEDEACPRCVVWATRNGTYYHAFSDCTGMRNALPISRTVALEWKKQACPVCDPDQGAGAIELYLEADVFSGDVLAVGYEYNIDGDLIYADLSAYAVESIPAKSVDEAAEVIEAHVPFDMKKMWINAWQAAKPSSYKLNYARVYPDAEAEMAGSAYSFLAADGSPNGTLLYLLGAPWPYNSLGVRVAAGAQIWQYDGERVIVSEPDEAYGITHYDLDNYTLMVQIDSGVQGSEETFSLPLAYGGSVKRMETYVTVNDASVRIRGCVIDDSQLVLIVEAEDGHSLSAGLTNTSGLEEDLMLRLQDDSGRKAGWIVDAYLLLEDADAELSIDIDDGEPRIIRMEELIARWAGELSDDLPDWDADEREAELAELFTETSLDDEDALMLAVDLLDITAMFPDTEAARELVYVTMQDYLDSGEIENEDLAARAAEILWQ